MARCEGCIHQECCVRFAGARTLLCGDKADERCKLFKPTADVVHKSEVEELQTEIEELQAMVAKLRKENVELLVSKETDVHISMEKLVKVRTEHPIFKAIEEKVSREIFEEIEKTVFADMDFFKELKKKYIGEKE